MAITNKLITFNKLTSFETQLAQGNILNTSIVFIKDAKKIWTKGTYFDCSGGGSSNIAIINIDCFLDDLMQIPLSDVQRINSDIYTIVFIYAQHQIVYVLNKQAPMEFRGLCIDNIVYRVTIETDGTVDVYDYNLALKSDIPNTDNFALKSEIPSVTESTVSDWGFTKNTGTITGVSANGISVATSGVANIPAASTSAYGVTKLSSATNSTSTSLAATASAVKAAYDLANSYKGTVTGVKINGTTKNPSSGVVDLGTVITSHQALKTINNESIVGSGNVSVGTLTTVATQETIDSVDGFKTINGQSIIGSGNIEISGGGGKEIVEVTVSSGSIRFTGIGSRPSFEPNKIYYATSVVSEAIGISSVVQPTDDVGEYALHFTTTEDESWAGILSFEAPSNWLWANGEIPSLETNTHYELSVVATKLGTDYIYKAVLTPFKSV